MNIKGKNEIKIITHNVNNEKLKPNKLTIESLFENYKDTDYKTQEYDYGDKKGREIW